MKVSFHIQKGGSNKMPEKERPNLINIDNNQMFSADYVSHRLRYHWCRIERAMRIAVSALIMATAGLIAIIWLIIR